MMMMMMMMMAAGTMTPLLLLTVGPELDVEGWTELELAEGEARVRGMGRKASAKVR